MKEQLSEISWDLIEGLQKKTLTEFQEPLVRTAIYRVKENFSDF